MPQSSILISWPPKDVTASTMASAPYSWITSTSSFTELSTPVEVSASYARLLRERFGYDGELRAVGDVLLEQLAFMDRCGFDAYELKSESALEDWRIASSDMSVWYQPTGDGRKTVLQLRHPRGND